MNAREFMQANERDRRGPTRCEKHGFMSWHGPCPKCEQEKLTDDLIGALEDAVEYAKDVLAHHDARLGRTIKKNRDYAEQIESDIQRLTELEKRLGGEG